MVWVRIDDHYDEHPKHARVGPLGHALWLAGLAYSNRNLTDGFIPWAIAQSLVSWTFLGVPEPNGSVPIVTACVTAGTSKESVTCGYVIKLLLHAGIWEERDGGYYIHDFPLFQPLKTAVLEQRERDRIRQTRKRSRKESERDSGVSHGHVTALPVPVPVLKKRKPSVTLTGDNGFSQLWVLHPGPKGSKQDAVREYQKHHPPAEALDALRRQIEYKLACDRSGKFCAELPHLHRWIKKHRWEDELPAIPTQDPDLFEKLKRMGETETPGG